MAQVFRLRDLRERYQAGDRDFRRTSLPAVALDATVYEDLDLRGARLEGVELLDVTFVRCDFRYVSLRGFRAYGGVKFIDCDLSLAVLSGCSLAGVAFDACRFEDTEIQQSFLRDVKIVRCQLKNVSFVGTHFSAVVFDETTAEACRLGNAIFIASSLDPFCDAARFRAFSGGPAMDWRSILLTAANPNLREFLVYCGVPELLVGDMIRAARALDRKARRMRSTFISYGTPDSTFALGLRDYLERNGVRTFFFEKDAVPGQKLHDVMRRGINDFDRVILICSESSLNRKGVRNEIRETLARESRDGGVSYLIPITRDDYVFNWTDELAQPIRDRVVADFRNADVNTAAFRDAFDRLLSALRNEELQSRGA